MAVWLADVVDLLFCLGLPSRCRRRRQSRRSTTRGIGRLQGVFKNAVRLTVRRPVDRVVVSIDDFDLEELASLSVVVRVGKVGGKALGTFVGRQFVTTHLKPGGA